MLTLGIDLLKRGFLPDAPDKPIHALLADGLSRWLSSMTGPLSAFELTAMLHSKGSDVLPQDLFNAWEASGSEGRPGGATTLDLASDALTLGISVGGRLDLLVGSRIERLESACEGLGWTALSVAEEAGAHWGLLWRRWALDCASYLYWGWASDEHGFEDATGEPAAECGLLRAEFDEAYPHRDIPVVGPGRLRRLAGHEDALVRDVSKAILDLRSLSRESCPVQTLARELHKFDDDYISPEPAVLLGWENFHLGYRLGDDFLELEGEAGRDYLPVLAAMSLRGDSPLQRAELVWSAALRRLGALDRLVQAIGSPACNT